MFRVEQRGAISVASSIIASCERNRRNHCKPTSDQAQSLQADVRSPQTPKTVTVNDGSYNTHLVFLC
jgi:hypothetical protein